MFPVASNSNLGSLSPFAIHSGPLRSVRIAVLLITAWYSNADAVELVRRLRACADPEAPFRGQRALHLFLADYKWVVSLLRAQHSLELIPKPRLLAREVADRFSQVTLHPLAPEGRILLRFAPASRLDSAVDACGLVLGTGPHGLEAGV